MSERDSIPNCDPKLLSDEQLLEMRRRLSKHVSRAFYDYQLQKARLAAINREIERRGPKE